MRQLAHPSYQSVFAAESRTATTTSPAFTNHSAAGALLVMVVSAVTSTPSVTPKVQVSPDGLNSWADYLTLTTPLSGTGTTTYLLYPGIDPSADGNLTESWNLPLPRFWRVVMTHGDADAITYTVTVQYL